MNITVKIYRYLKLFFLLGLIAILSSALIKAEEKDVIPCSGDSGNSHVNTDSSPGGFVANSATVASTVTVSEFASVCDKAIVEGDALVLDNSVVAGRARIFSGVKIHENAKVSGNAVLRPLRPTHLVEVFGNAKIFGNARIQGNAKIFGDAEVSGNIVATGNAKISERATVSGRAEIRGDAQIFGASTLRNGSFGGTVQVCDNITISIDINENEGLKYCKALRFPVADFTVDVVEGEAPLTVNAVSVSHAPEDTLTTINWDFGDSSKKDVLNQNEISHTYSEAGHYFLNLSVLNSAGNIDTKEVVVEVREPVVSGPVAIISADKFSFKDGQNNITLNGEDSYHSFEDIEISEYKWNFSDGVESFGKKISKTFQSPGVFEVTLTVKDVTGKTDSSTQKILVNCELGEADNICLSVVGAENGILPTSFVNFVINSGFQNSWKEGKIPSVKIIREDYSMPPIDLTDIVVVDGADLITDKNLLLSKLSQSDFRRPFRLLVDGLDMQDKARSGETGRFYFGSSTISGNVNVPGATLEINGVKTGLSRTIVVASNGNFSISDLPFDHYVIWAKSGDKIAHDSIILEPDTTSNVNLNLNDPFSTKLKDKMMKMEGDADSNFSMDEVVFTPSETGFVSKQMIFTVPENQNEVHFALQAIIQNAISGDTYEILLAFDDGNGGLEVITEYGKISDLTGTLFGEEGQKRLRSNWFSQSLQVPSDPEKRKFYLSLKTANMGRESSNLDCLGAIGASIKAGEPAKPYIPNDEGSMIKRIDNNPKNDFFPTSIDLDVSKNKNPFLKTSKDWKLTFEVPYFLPEKYKLDGKGLELSILGNRKFQKQIVKKVSITKDKSEDKLIVDLQISDLKSVPFLSKWSESAPEAISFQFRLLTKKFGKSVKSAPVSFKMIPLYDGKRIGCPILAGRSSMYGTKKSISMLNGLVNGENKLSSLSCTGMAAPFGGVFDVHTSKEYQNGHALGVRYFGFNPFEDINRLANKKVLILEQILGKTGVDVDFAISARSEAMSELSGWIVDNRQAFENLRLNHPIRKFGGILIADGKGLIHPLFEKDDWNRLALFQGGLPKLSGDNSIPFLSITRGEVGEDQVGTCQFFEDIGLTTDETCGIGPNHIFFSATASLDRMTLNLEN